MRDRAKVQRSRRPRTFAVGFGAGVNESDMNGLALAGETEQAYFVSAGVAADADLVATLNAIRSRL